MWAVEVKAQNTCLRRKSDSNAQQNISIISKMTPSTLGFSPIVKRSNKWKTEKGKLIF